MFPWRFVPLAEANQSRIWLLSIVKSYIPLFHKDLYIFYVLYALLSQTNRDTNAIYILPLPTFPDGIERKPQF